MADAGQVLSCAELFQWVATVHRQAAAAALREFGVTEPGTGLLWLLGGQGDLPMGAAALGLSCDPSNVTLLAVGLEELGLVQRVADPDDRRRRLLRLTGRGRAARAAMVTSVAATSPLSALPEHQFRSLLAALRLLTADEARHPARCVDRAGSEPDAVGELGCTPASPPTVT